MPITTPTPAPPSAPLPPRAKRTRVPASSGSPWGSAEGSGGRLGGRREASLSSRPSAACGSLAVCPPVAPGLRQPANTPPPPHRILSDLSVSVASWSCWSPPLTPLGTAPPLQASSEPQPRVRALSWGEPRLLALVDVTQGAWWEPHPRSA